MGKGDRRTTKGKINKKSYGNVRKHKARVKAAKPAPESGSPVKAAAKAPAKPVAKKKPAKKAAAKAAPASE